MSIATLPSANAGVVYTRRWVVETILDLVGYTPSANLAERRLLDPAVGTGAFLIPAAERLVASAQSHGVPITALAGSISAVDIAPEHVTTCRQTVTHTLVQAGVPAGQARRLSNAWVRQGDFLLDDEAQPADYIVGNPPYIRLEDLPSAKQTAYRKHCATMRGRADIYIGFYEKALALLAPNGKLGFICADRWMKNAYGKHLRALITKEYAVESMWQMHDVDAFEDSVSAYPAVTIIRNGKPNKPTIVDTQATFGEQDARQAVHFVQNGKRQVSQTHWSGARLKTWFNTDDFWPTGSPQTIQLLEHLQRTFQPLEAHGNTRVGIGVATGADKAYIVDRDAAPDVEPDRLLPLVMAADIRNGTLTEPTKLMINPWDEAGNLIDLATYPKLREHLDAHPAVKTRYVARKNPSNWHRTIDKVQPGLAAQPKLLLQDMKATITPVLEPGGFYPHHNLYYITSDVWDIEVLGGLLLSRVAEAFVNAYGVKMRGGTLRFQAQYLRKIATPAPETLNPNVARALRQAFRTQDRDAATTAAKRAYGIAA